MEQSRRRRPLRCCRTDPLGKVEIVDAVKVTRWEDHNLLAGMPYRYHVRLWRGRARRRQLEHRNGVLADGRLRGPDVICSRVWEGATHR